MLIPLRDENPRVIVPYVTFAIIALNVLAFLFQLGLGFDAVSRYQLTLSYGLIPATFSNVSEEEIVRAHEQHLSKIVKQRVQLNARPRSPLITLFTSMFMHGGIMHLVWNMWSLWIFGDNVEGVLGHRRYALFYLLSGVAAGLTQVMIDMTSILPMVGASGAIAGVLGAYMITFPRAKVIAWWPFFLWFGPTMSLPAVYYLGFWFLIQLTNGFTMIGFNTTGGVAWFAHIGGFAAGVILVRLLRMITFEKA
ncbi:MAG: rhomboid family intramembrane serine protease [Candidatus Neomarinimicrobiota bacterium]